MVTLTKSQYKDIDFILSEYNYSHLYENIKQVLGDDLASFFAFPEVLNQRIDWAWQAGKGNEQIRSLASLSEDEKDLAADLIEQLSQEIKTLLSKHSEYKNIVEDLFITPDFFQDLKIITTSKGIKPILTQWACKPRHSEDYTNSLNLFLGRPRPAYSQVIVETKYEEDSTAPDILFFTNFMGVETQKRTDETGKCVLGKIKAGVRFKTSVKINEQIELHYEFEVAEGASYQMSIPLFTTGQIKVLNQKGTPLANTEIYLTESNGIQQIIKTNAEGIIPLDNIRVTHTITFAEIGNPTNTQTHTIQKEENHWTLTIEELFSNDAIIKVINNKNNTEPYYPLIVTYQNETKELRTDQNGIVKLPHLPIGTRVKITDSNQIDNFQEGIITEGTNEFIIHTTSQEPKFVKIKLINQQNQPLPQIPIDFTHNGTEHSLITNHEGICTLPYETFSDRKKIKANIHLPKVNKKGETKEKIIKKSFQFKQEQLEYTLKLKPRSRWWLWLLLLLLLPLLLIKCDKTINVRTINQETKTNISNAEVVFTYQEAYLYDKGSFFTEDKRLITQKTNKQGLASFDTLGYSLYSYLFKPFSEAKIYAQSQCYTSEVYTNYFHALSNESEIVLEMKPIIAQLDFRVIDREDNEPLPQANVLIIAELDGKQYKEEALTEPDGRVIFNKIPRCANINLVKASLEGYYPDSLTQKTVRGLAGEINTKRLLKLKPIKAKIIFFVKDCKTKQPIADATATLTLDVKGKQKVIVRKTNVNGIGKGEYEDAYINANMNLSVEKAYYKKGSLPKTYTVSDFLKLSEEERTICLEPEDIAITLNNCDSKTNSALAGVKNVVTIIREGKEITNTLISNGNGSFTIPGLRPDDIVSIVASYPPDYRDNTTQIKNVKAKDLINFSANQKKICLEKNATAIACDEDIKAGMGASSGMYFDLGASQNSISLDYDVKSQRDRITIYCGKGTSGKIIFEEILLNREGSPKQIPYHECEGQGVTVVVTPADPPYESSAWKFKLSCPK